MSNFFVGTLHAIRAMANVTSNLDAEVATDRACAWTVKKTFKRQNPREHRVREDKDKDEDEETEKEEE